MPRLPIPGSDDDTWGNILNDYLLTSHNEDGTLKSHTHDAAAITTGTLIDARIPNLAISKITNLQTSLDGKAAATHTHAAADIASGTIATARLSVATDTAQGIVELATTAETTTGTDTTRAVTPAGVKAVADTKANTSHSHTKAQITDFAHTHPLVEITEVPMPSSNDVNDCNVQGIYYVPQGALNAPTSNPGLLEVFVSTTSSFLAFQRYTSTIPSSGAPRKVYVRGRPIPSSSWVSWAELAGPGHTHDAANITTGEFAPDRIPKPGGLTIVVTTPYVSGMGKIPVMQFNTSPILSWGNVSQWRINTGDASALFVTSGVYRVSCEFRYVRDGDTETGIVSGIQYIQAGGGWMRPYFHAVGLPNNRIAAGVEVMNGLYTMYAAGNLSSHVYTLEVTTVFTVERLYQ